MKRSAEETATSSHKKHKHEEGRKYSTTNHTPLGQASDRSHKSSSKSHGSPNGNSGYGKSHQSSKSGHSKGQGRETSMSYSEALEQLPPSNGKSSDVPSYVPFTVTSDLPPLPSVASSNLAEAPFRHKSLIHAYDRNTTNADISYERLEFIGDAYIELIASRIIYERFSHLTAGRQSQLRELLVKNETLAEFSRAYKFEERIQMASMNHMMRDVEEKGKWQGSKGYTKILGDVFEAYVAAVVLDAVKHGFSVAEKWLTTLWAPKLVSEASKDKIQGRPIDINLVHSPDADARKIYNPTAKQELQKRILSHSGVKLEYETYKASVELKGEQLGQNKHFIALYLTGYGYERKLLGKGEGKNKVEAGNWAAIEAMHGDCKAIVDECEEKLKLEKERKKAERAAAEEKGQ